MKCSSRGLGRFVDGDRLVVLGCPLPAIPLFGKQAASERVGESEGPKPLG